MVDLGQKGVRSRGRLFKIHTQKKPGCTHNRVLNFIKLKVIYLKFAMQSSNSAP